VRKTKAIEALDYITSNNLPPDGEINEWVQPSDTDDGYALEVIVKYENKIYKSAKDNNKDLPTDVLSWQYQRPTNEIAWSDSFPTTVSTSTTDTVLEFDHVFDYSALVFGNMIGTDLHIEVQKQDNSYILDKTVSLNDYNEPSTWDGYYIDFGDTHQKTEHIEMIDSVEVDVKIKITITSKNGKTQLGLFQIGTFIDIGCTAWDVSIERSPSAKIIEDNGTKKVIGWDSAWRKTSYTLYFIQGQDFYEELKKMDRENTKTGVFLGDDTGERYEFATIGFYDGYQAHPSDKTISIDVYSIDTY